MKQNKIDFKDLCPSGRDTKFTRSSSSNLLDQNTLPILDSDYDLLKTYFKKVNSKELLATVGGLHLFPENQCHTIRLEAASRIACALEKTGNKKIYRKQLKKILNNGLPTEGDIGIKEDPSENLFTENILFHGGNYVIYSGNSVTDTFVLDALFDTIFKNKNVFPIDFVSEIESSSVALLSISNEIVRRMDHTRNMDVVNTWRKNIYFPSDDFIEKSRNAVIFTIKEIDDLFRKYGFNNSILSPFCLHLNDAAFSENDFQDEMFQYFPFIRIEDRLIVFSPSSIVSSIREFILKTAKIQSVYSLLFKKFKENMWESVHHYLIALSFLPSSLKLPKFDEEYEFDEAIYAIDIDKIAYVQLLVENGEKLIKFNYEKLIESNYEMSNAEKRLQKLVSKRDKQVSKFLYDTEKFTNDDVLYIKVLCSMEGEFVFSFERKSKQLAIPINDLKIISMLNDANCLAFWKYAKAEKEVILNPINSFLDNFNHYYKNNCSFHIPDTKRDELQKPFIFLLSGSSIELKSKILQDIDMHGVLIGNPPNYTSVINYNEDKEIPIYIINSLFTGHFYQLIEGYDQPIWVCPDGSYENSNTNNEKLSLFIDTISYWLWQITPTLKNHLTPLGQNPISIEVSLEESSMWDSFKETKDDIENLEVNFQWDIIDSKIRLPIPSAIIPVLMKPHNLGERWLLDAILCAFGEMLEYNSFTDTLNEKNRNIIVNKHAPFGLKKKLVIVGSGQNASLDTRFVPKIRMIQDPDVQEQMDWLASALSNKMKLQNKFTSKKECTYICNSIVSEYLSKIKAKISLFCWQDLLQYLIISNEAICHQRAYSYLTTPTILECFSDIESLVNSEIKNNFLIDSTALSIRTLIEIIAAEPPTGKKQINLCEMDELIAISSQLINWAMISDYIHQDLTRYSIYVLNSGRIIAEPVDYDNIFLPFQKSRLMEQYESASLNYENHFVKDISDFDDLIKTYEIPFKAEFGLSYSEILKLTAFLIDLGLERESSSPNMPLSELKTRIEEELNWDTELTEKSIELFSLKNRKCWEIPPLGFNKNDILPWKYNRRLSYVRKPLIIGPGPKDDPLVFWGIRHVEEAARYLINLVFSGRYKVNREECSEDIKKLIGSSINKSGTDFTLEVKNWFETNTGFKVDSEVPIGPNEIFHSDVNLGDVDVLAIDDVNYQIYLIECKCINFGRNAYEVANEVERFLGNRKSKNSWTAKHLKRDEWVKSNVNSLIREYELEDKTFRVNSIFIISSDILTKYIHDTPLPMVSFSQLLRDGISALPK